MSPSQFAATNILPLLARLVLCLAFLPQGWNNLMRDVEYTAHDAQRLRELGVRGITDPDPRKADVALGALRGWAIAEPQDPPSGTATSAQPPANPPQPVPATAPQERASERPSQPERLSPLAPLTQRGLYTLTLLADRARLPFPVELAWAVAGVQLVGGACMLLGLFSRVWGLLMSVRPRSPRGRTASSAPPEPAPSRCPTPGHGSSTASTRRSRTPSSGSARSSPRWPRSSR
jgi:hypothetical protein